MKRIGLFVLVGILPGLVGFKYLDPPRKWDEGDMPHSYYVGDDAPAGLTFEETLSVLQIAFDNWGNVDCSPLEAQFADTIVNEPSFGRPDRTQITFNGDLESGVLAAAVTHSSDEVVPYNGVNFFRTTSMNIIFNSGPTWGTPQDIASPQCFGLNSFLGVSTHEIGHGYGLGHSCDDGEPCPDPLLRAATMYWTGSQCDPGQESPNADDSAGINAIYGVAIDFDVESVDTPTAVGAAPLTVEVSVPDEFQGGRFDDYEWNFGDGSPHVFLSSGDSELDGLLHTYELEGQYTITLTATGDDATCGGAFETEKREVGAVLACGPPVPSADYTNEGDFVVAMINTSPLGAFGCTTEYTWILDGDAASALHTYEPAYVFTEAGTHTVTLTASGPGGEGSAEVTIDVTRQSAAGCNASLAGRGEAASLSLLLLGLVLSVGRRRRD